MCQIVVVGVYKLGFLLQMFNDGFLYFVRKMVMGVKIYQMEV